MDYTAIPEKIAGMVALDVAVVRATLDVSERTAESPYSPVKTYSRFTKVPAQR